MIDRQPFVHSFCSPPGRSSSDTTSSAEAVPRLSELLFLPLNRLRHTPVGLINLACAEMLPDTASLDVATCLQTLSAWIDRVRHETNRYFPAFQSDPARYHDSEAYFRALMLITVLQQDFGVTYDLSCRDSMKFESSNEGFIHGLLTGKRSGTCANLPVLYATIGRALGYPLRLVSAKGHLFVRWVSRDGRTRLNIEGSGTGLLCPPDEYYMTWPKPITEEEVRAGIYLRDLDPIEEFGHFMATRGHCLYDRGHLLDATVAYAHAHRLAPTDPNIMGFLLGSLNQELELQNSGKLPWSYRDAEKWDEWLPKQRFRTSDAYTQRVAGVHINSSASKS